MGIYEKPSIAFLERLGHHFHFRPPLHHGLDTVASIEAMERGDVKVFVGLGGNFAAAAPDTKRTLAALKRCDLTVSIATKLNRTLVTTGRESLILPCLARTERDEREGTNQFVTVENSMGIVHSSRGHAEPAHPDLKSEVAIVAGIARATLGDQVGGTALSFATLPTNYDTIRDQIAAVIPGFERFNERLSSEGAFALPNAARDRVFATETGRARFMSSPLSGRWRTLTEGQFVLMTLRSHDQYNTTIYGFHDRYRGVSHGRNVLFVNTEDAEARGWSDGDKVEVRHASGDPERVLGPLAIHRYEMPRGCVATYFPEANVLIPLEDKAKHSHTPVSKWVPVTVVSAEATGKA